MGQKRNNRLRFDMQDIINSHDGYFTIVNSETDTIRTDRLGLSTFLIRNEYDGHKEDLEKMFYTFHSHMRKDLLEEYDLNLKGSTEITDVQKLVSKYFTNEDEKKQALTYLD